MATAARSRHYGFPSPQQPPAMPEPWDETFIVIKRLFAQSSVDF